MNGIRLKEAKQLQLLVRCLYMYMVYPASSPPLPLSHHSPDGVEISAERMREYEALDIKVCVCVCACTRV